jgi:RNase P/RNase MRP subunit p30
MIDVVKVKGLEEMGSKLGLELIDLKSLVFRSQGSRKDFEDKKVDVIFGLESIEDKDKIFQRNSGLNHILCGLAFANDIIVGFDFSLVLNSTGFSRSKILGRMKQNVKLCRKYKVKMMIGSFASEKYDLRGKFELFSFGKVIGMTDGEVKLALNAVSERIKFKEFKKSGKYVCKGVELID